MFCICSQSEHESMRMWRAEVERQCPSENSANGFKSMAGMRIFRMRPRQPMNDLAPKLKNRRKPIVEFICAHVIANSRLSASCW